jgi:MFS family permease
MVTAQRALNSHRSQSAALPTVVRRLVLARAVNRIGAFTLPFLALLLTQQRGWSPTGAGLLLAGFGVAAIPSRLLGGRLAETWGRRRTMVLGLSGCATAQLGLALAQGITSTVAAVLTLGLCFEIYEPASQAIVADLVSPEDQPAAYSLMAAALAGAAVVAGGLASVLAGLDLRWLFVADALSCLACAGLLVATLPGDRRPTVETDSADAADAAASADAVASSPWRDRRLLVLLGVQTCFAVVYLQQTIALPLTLVDRGLAPRTLGMVLVASAITMLATAPLLRRVRFRSASTTRQLRFGYLVLATGLLGWSVARSSLGFVAGAVVLAVGDLVLMGQLLSVVATLAPPTSRARYLAVFGLSWGVAGVVAPLAAITLLATVGTTAAWCLLATVCGLLGMCARTYLPRTA